MNDPGHTLPVEFDPQLVHDWLRRAARRHPDKTALVCEGSRLSYRELDDASTRLAHNLVAAGVARQDRVVVFLDNSPEAVIALYGILKAGAVAALATSQLKPPKLAYVLGNAGARLLVAPAARAPLIVDALARLDAPCDVLWVGGAPAPAASRRDLDWALMLAAPAGEPPPLPRCIDADLAWLIYTSGSTGQPKGVMSTHRSVVSAARSIVQYLGNTPDDVVLAILPLSFDYGLYQVIMAAMFGGTVVLEKSFVFLHPILERIAQEKVTGLPIVPTVLAMLLKMKDLQRYDLDSLRYITNTGAALPVEHIRRLRDIVPHVRLFSMFGLTECKRICFLPPEEIDRRPGSVGKAMPNCEVFVVDAHGREVAPGEVGELVIRGSNVMSGYWRDPEATARVYRRDGSTGEAFLHSGDWFRRDAEGYLYFLGRKDDMIKCRGERVGAKEVENGLCEYPGVVEAAVIGVPDEVLGQAIKAFVVVDPGADLGARDLLKHCTDNLEIYMVPKFIEFVDALPKTPHGKIDKLRLKASGSGAS
ncbi:MAG TPA: AMP-binding protein [Rhodocyclaceae bacterium]|nr:AMP-binding protein [Rhodocyclaceae bacterium]